MIVKQSPNDSALARAQHGDEALWGLPEQLMAQTVDYLAWLTWSKTKDAQHNRGKPTPIPRPGIDSGVTRIGKGALSMDEMDDWLGWSNN